jgi:anti-sigma regulatory factor (Ser/Thr protein kinase)
VDVAQVGDVLLAVNEACTNAIEHGHDGDGGQIRVSAAIEDGELRIDIADRGRWRPPAGEDPMRGRGLPLMRALVRDVEVTPGRSGTVVVLRAPVIPARPVRAGSAAFS